MKKSSQRSDKNVGMTRYQKILIGIALAFLLYSILGFLVLPVLLKSTLERKLTENLKRQVSIENIQVNPYSLKVTVNNFLIRDRGKDADFLAFDRLFIDLEAVSLFKKAMIVKSLVLGGPKVNIDRYNDLNYNFSDIAVGAGSEQKKKTDSKPFLFSINNIEIQNGAITFLDEPKDTTHTIHDLNLAVPFLSNVIHYVKTYVHPDFSAIINGTPVKLSGQTIPFHDSLRTVFNISAAKLSIPAYLAYLPESGSLSLKSGFLDVTASLGFEMEPGKKPAVSLSGDFSVKQLAVVSSENETYLSLPRVDIKLADSRPLEMDFHFSRVALAAPEFLLRRNIDGDILPLALLPKNTEPAPDEPPSSIKESALKLVIDEIGLNGGTLTFEDQNNAEPFQTTLMPIEIKVDGLSTLKNAEASYNISLQTEAGESIAMNGSLSLNPLTVDLQVALEDLKIPRFSPYWSEIVTVQVMEGNVGLAASLHYAKTDEDETLRADNITAEFNSIAVNDKDNRKLVTIPALSIKDGSWEPAARRITFGDFSSSGGELHLVRQKEGLVILNELLRPGETAPEKPAGPDKETPAPWLLRLGKGAIDQYSIVMVDHVPAEPTTLLLDNIQLFAENISTAEKSTGAFDLGFRIDKNGMVSIKGPIVIEPLSTSLDVNLANLQVKTLQPYFADKVNLVISNGAVSVDGQLKISRGSNKELLTLFQGKTGIADFASFDPVAGEDFLKWKNLSLEGIKYDSTDFSLRIKEINWLDFYNKLAVFDTGATNLAAIMKGSKEPDTETAEKSEPAGKKDKSLLVEIGAVKLDNGKIEFLDRNITPNYASSFSELSGAITGLSSKADIMAAVDISGKLDQHAPLKITGKVNPLREDFFADLVVDFSDIELSPTSPYTGKFIGYTIAKGKLSLDLQYLVEDTKITGKNKAFLDQFTLGDTVESPDALKLPINLAIALLKNRKGEITLNVPVKGDLDDPEFSIGGIVFKAIISLIAKAATSPFALLGALLPEGEDLQYVDFEPGSVRIGQEYTGNLDSIAKALFERPGLKMDIKGSVKADEERPVLHEKQFEQLLKNEKLKELSKKKELIPPLDEITIEPEEYEDFLKKAYKTAEFEKPKNVLGLNKRLPPEEMEKLLHDHIVITADDLRLLAIERANAVKSFLVDSGPVEPERIFIVEPAMTGDEGGAKRAEMIIK